MSALTRILNNQIFGKTIIASQKIADGTITGSLFSSNVTVPGDFLITGNLFVLGSSAYTTIASTNTFVNDPLITLNNGFAGTNTYDEGLIFNRGSLQNRALVWSEFNKEFRLIGTTETGTTYGNVAVSNYANLHVGNLTVDYTLTTTGDFFTTGFINTSGNVSAAVGLFGAINSTGFINTLGNVSAAVGVFGGVNTTGYINAGGNVSTPQLNAGQINTTGNVLGAAATFNSSQINGNQSVTGYLNVTGNVLADAGTLNTLAINSATNSSDPSGSTGALQIKGGVSIAKDVWIGGNLYAANIVGVTANVITVEDPLLFLKPSYTFPYNYDIGVYSAFTGTGLTTAGNVLQHTGIVRHQETNTWTFASNLAEPGAAHVTFDNNTVYDPIKAGNLNLVGTNDSTTSSTGALIVAGGAGIGGNLNIAGNSRITLGKNLAGGVVYPENDVQITTNANAKSRISLQNLNSGAFAGTEFVAMSDIGSNLTSQITVGISSSTFNSDAVAPIIKPNDAYVVASFGSNLILTSGSDVIISTGVSNVGMRVNSIESNIGVQYSAQSVSATTGAFTVVGGVGIGKQLNVGKGATVNTTNGLDGFIVKSSTAGNIALFANVASGYAAFTESVIIGGGNTTVQPGATLKVNSVTAMMVPAGPTAARPSSLLGFPEADAPGMIRFNTTSNALEYYDGSNWTVAGSVFTVISDRQFSGNTAGGFGNVDGTNTTFTLQATASTAGSIVSINGVMQFPTLAYSVSGTTLTFTEPPAPGDVIDARILTTTSTVTSIASASGLSQFIAEDSGLQFWTGTSATTQRANIDQSGNFNFLTGNEFTYDQPTPVQATNNNLTLLDSFSANAYTTAKYIVSMKQGTGNVQAMEALLTQSTVGSTAGTAYVTTYGIVNTGNTMGTLAANVDVSGSWTVKMWLIPNNGTAISNVKVMTTYIV